MFLEYALDTAHLARAAGLRNLFITDGYATPEAVALLAAVLDAANVDLKAFDDALLPAAVRRPAGATCWSAIVAMRRGGHLAGADHARHPRPQRRAGSSSGR